MRATAAISPPGLMRADRPAAPAISSDRICARPYICRAQAGRAPTRILPGPLALATLRCRILLGAAGRVGELHCAGWTHAGPRGACRARQPQASAARGESLSLSTPLDV